MDESVLAIWRAKKDANEEQQRVANLRKIKELTEETTALLSRLDDVARVARAVVVDTSNWMRAAERGEHNLYIAVPLPSSILALRSVVSVLPNILGHVFAEQLAEGYVIVYATQDGPTGTVYAIYKPRKMDLRYTGPNTVWYCDSIVTTAMRHNTTENHVDRVYDIRISPAGK